jgi:hypothetical protein
MRLVFLSMIVIGGVMAPTACSSPTLPPPSSSPATTASITPKPTSVPTRATEMLRAAPTVTRTPVVLPTPTHAAYKPGAPLERAAPRTLLNASDLARMKQWIEKYAWARAAHDQIAKNADAYPARYLQKYNLAAPDLPPTGGQWSLWYICPDGLRLQYQPTHTPPHFCPSDGKYYAAPLFVNRPTLYDEVIYQNRHLDLAEFARDLGLTYALTGEKKYADNAAMILRAYAKVYPGYAPHDKDGKTAKSGGKATAQTLDEAQFAIQLAWAYDLISATLSADEQKTIADNVLRAAAANIQGNRAKLSNWQTWHNAAIAAIGFALNDAALVNAAYYDPENGFFTQIQNGAAQDGFWWEGSWGYHFFTTQPMLYLAEMGERAGMDAYAQPNLRALLLAPLQMALPDQRLPAFNDDGGTTLASRAWLYEIGYQRYRDPAMRALLREPRVWQALLWGAETLPSADQQPPNTSAVLPKAGFAILRAGDAQDPRYLAFKFGSHGGGHGHYDKLHYITAAFSRVLAFDPGTRSYAAAAHNAWDKVALAHNTVVVDEQNQAEATGNLQRYLAFPAFALATADAGTAYPSAAITRTLALTADYWFEFTRAASRDGKPHRFDWIYHNPGTLASALHLAPYTAFPKKNGYEYLSNTRATGTNMAWGTTWDMSGIGQPYGSVYRNNEFPATFTLAQQDRLLTGQMSYDFMNANDYAVYSTRLLNDAPKETPTLISARVYGDGSNNRLVFRIIDATGEKFTKEFGALTWTGWQLATLSVDKTWSKSGAGNNDGVIDLPVSQIALQISRAPHGARWGRVFTREITLTFPNAGRVVVEDFAGAYVALRMLGANDTTVILGNGIDQTNAPIPFAMARRQSIATDFAALFEPFREAGGRIKEFESSGAGWRVSALGAFVDSILIADENTRGEKSFGGFTTDASIAYARQDAANNLQTLVVANATKFSEGARAWFAASVPITAQIVYAGDALAITTQGARASIRVYAPKALQMNVNGAITELKRDGEYVLVIP